MLSDRSRTVKALAILLPVNMLVVFFACASLCLAACGEHERETSACCRSGAADSCAGTTLESSETSSCQLVPVDPAVLSDGKLRVGTVLVSALPASIAVAAVTPHVNSIVPRAAGPPARERPLDRLPVLLI